MRAASSRPPGRASRCSWFSFAEQVELLALGLRGRGAPGRGGRGSGRRPGGTACPEYAAGMKPLRPVRLAADRPAALVEEHDVARQVLVLGAQAVHRPAPERRPADERLAGVHRHQGRAVGVAVGVARADDGQLVGVLADLREVVGDQQAALAAGPELAERRREEADLAAAGVDELLVRRAAAGRRTSPVPAWGRTCRPGSARRSSSGRCTLFAFAGKCGGFGASGEPAASLRMRQRRTRRPRAGSRAPARRTRRPSPRRTSRRVRPQGK